MNVTIPNEIPKEIPREISYELLVFKSLNWNECNFPEGNPICIGMLVGKFELNSKGDNVDVTQASFNP